MGSEHPAMDERQDLDYRFHQERRLKSESHDLRNRKQERQLIDSKIHGAQDSVDFRPHGWREAMIDRHPILVHFKPYVRTEHLYLAEEEENPVWGNIVQQVENLPRAHDEIQSDEEFFSLLSIHFSADVIQRVHDGFEYSRTSSLGPLGPAYLRRGSYPSFVTSLIENIVEEMSDTSKEAESSAAAETESAIPAVPAVSPILSPNDDPAGREFFRRVPVREVSVGSFETPGKYFPRRLSIIMDKSKMFCDKVTELSGNLPGPPYAGKGADHDVLVFHGTRVSSLPDFQTNGISPRPKKSDFSREGTFYVSNSFRYSYEHVLLNVWKAQKEDRVAIYCFKVPGKELAGLGQEGFTVRHFADQSAEWVQFLQHNYSTSGLVYPPPPLVDITSGPVGIGSRPDGIKGKKAGEEDIKDYSAAWRKGVDSFPACVPLQLSINSARARKWLAEHLDCCYVEIRV